MIPRDARQEHRASCMGLSLCRNHPVPFVHRFIDDPSPRRKFLVVDTDSDPIDGAISFHANLADAVDKATAVAVNSQGGQ